MKILALNPNLIDTHSPHHCHKLALTSAYFAGVISSHTATSQSPSSSWDSELQCVQVPVTVISSVTIPFGIPPSPVDTTGESAIEVFVQPVSEVINDEGSAA